MDKVNGKDVDCIFSADSRYPDFQITTKQGGSYFISRADLVKAVKQATFVKEKKRVRTYLVIEE